MKVKYLSMIAIAAMMATACGNDDPDGGGSNDESKNIDYTEANAASWGNYMEQVAILLAQDSQELYDAWNTSYEGGASFASVFKTHNGGDYASALNCLEQIVDGCADIANEVGTAKIGDPYNLWQQGEKEKALYAVESWYSWHSREDYSNNIYSIRNSYYGSLNGEVSANSLATLINSINPSLDAELRASIQGTADAILAIPQPFRNNIASAASVKAMEACADLEELLTRKLKPALEALDENDSRMQAIVDNYVDNVVLPTYFELKNLNNDMLQAVKNFKLNPANETFASCCEAWLKARAPWEKSEAFLFGPVDALGLDPNMDSWPLDQDAIVQILNSGKYGDLNWGDNNTDDEIEAVQSVRGFHTLEFLIFKDGQARKVNN